MTPYDHLRGRALRRHHRLLRRVLAGPVSIRYTRVHDLRAAERLHHAGLVTAVVSRTNRWLMFGARPFSEVTLYATEAQARASGYQVYPRRGRWL